MSLEVNKIVCGNCAGHGYYSCVECGGDGTCASCGQSCPACGGSGDSVECEVCDGSGLEDTDVETGSDDNHD